MDNLNGRRRTSPKAMVDELRDHVGGKAELQLISPVTAKEGTCDGGCIEIESVDETRVDVPGTTAEARFVAEGFVAQQVGNGEVESWRIAVKKFGKGWSQPTATGWYWDDDRYRSTATVGVKALTLSVETDVEEPMSSMEAHNQ